MHPVFVHEGMRICTTICIEMCNCETGFYRSMNGSCVSSCFIDDMVDLEDLSKLQKSLVEKYHMNFKLRAQRLSLAGILQKIMLTKDQSIFQLSHQLSLLILTTMTTMTIRLQHTPLSQLPCF